MTTALYFVTCALSGRRYVGITSRPISKRWTQHKYDAAKGSPLPLHVAIRKHGICNFEVVVLHSYTSRRAAADAEIALIAALELSGRAGYNASPGGDGGATMTGRRHSLETRAKMSAGAKARRQKPPPMTPEHRASQSRLFKGKSRPLEVVEKIRAGWARRRARAPLVDIHRIGA